MACFDNFIGLDELCDPSTATSGYNLNMIGISKTEIEQIITKDFSSVQDFVTKKSQFAISKMTGEIYNHLSPRFKADSILTGARIGYEDSRKELITQSGYVGISSKLNNTNSFVDFALSDISLFVNVSATVPVLIYNVAIGQLLQTVNVPTIAGEISTSFEKVVISAERKPLHLWIGYNAAAINSYKTSTHNGCSDCSGYTFKHKHIQATGSSIATPFLLDNLSPLTHTGGISLNYSVTCNHKDWLCNHKHILGMPALYATGIEICKHALLAAPNQRTNSYVIVNSELTDRRLAIFETEYEKLMRNILQNMAVPQDRNCFHCEQRIRSVTSLA